MLGVLPYFKSEKLKYTYYHVWAHEPLDVLKCLSSLEIKAFNNEGFSVSYLTFISYWLHILKTKFWWTTNEKYENGPKNTMVDYGLNIWHIKGVCHVKKKQYSGHWSSQHHCQQTHCFSCFCCEMYFRLKAQLCNHIFVVHVVSKYNRMRWMDLCICTVL